MKIKFIQFKIEFYMILKNFLEFDMNLNYSNYNF